MKHEKNKDTAVILINMPVRLYSGNRKDIRIPLGLLYLLTVLNQENHTSYLCDFQKDDISWEQVYQIIEQYPRCLIGFTCDSDNIHRVIIASDRLLEKYKHILVVLGGPHVTHLPEEHVHSRRVVIQGEGEYPLIKLAQHWLHGEGDISQIPSLVYSKDDRIISNPVDCGPFENVDMIPFPDYSLFLEDKFSKHMYIPGVATARGCMYQCYFCSEGNSPQRRYRPRSTENIKKELELIKAYYQNQLPYLAFVDDTFTSSYERTIQMCDIINDVFPDKAQFGFYCEGRVNVLSKHPDLMAHLKQAGLLRLQIGIESGSQDILDRINKQIRTKQIETVVQLCESNDIPTIFGAFICGLPGQTEDDVKKDIEYAKQLIDIAPGRMELEMSILSLLPGSEFYKNSSKWNFSVLDSECLTGLVTEDCFNETPLLRRSKIIELRSLFRDEISRYNMEKSMSIPRRKLLEHIVIATRRRMIPLTVRQMIRYPHANWLVLLRARQDHCFLWEVPQKRWEYIIPVHVENQVTPCNDNFIINEKSPMAFLLTKTEKQYYDYFAGKLSFTKIAEKISQQRKITQEQALNECVAVYEKCEQNLTAIVMA